MRSVLDSIFPRGNQLSEEAPGWNSMWQMLMDWNQSSSGVNVNADSAMRQATVNACVRVLAETLATMPKQVIRQKNNNRFIEVDNAVHYIFNITPNPWQSSFEFVEMMQGHLALRGNAFALIVPGVRGAVTELWPLHAGRMQVKRLTNMRLLYVYQDPSGNEQRYSQDQIFHLRGLSSDGLVGLSPIQMARDTIGLDLAAERYQGNSFKNGIKPSGYLTGPNALKRQDAEQMQASLMEAYAGEGNWEKPMVLWGGMKWEKMGMTNEDAEFLDSRKFTANEICKIFRMPPHMVAELTRSTNNNIEQQAIEFVRYTIMPWARRWEEAISRDLIVDDPTLAFKFDVSELLQGDAAARATYFNQAIMSGWMTPNQVRAKEGLDPYDDGDAYFMQGAMVTVDSIVNPPTQPTVDPVAAKEADDKQKQAEEDKAKLSAQLEIFKADIIEKTRQIGERDQKISLAAEAERILRIEATECKRDIERLQTDGEKNADEIARLTAEHEKLELAAMEKRKETELLKASNVEIESQLAEMRAAYDALAVEMAEVREKAESATAKLNAAIVENTRLLVRESKYQLQREIEGVQRIIKRQNGVASLANFFDKHAARMLAAIEPLMGQRSLLLECKPANEYVTIHIETSKTLLLEAFKGDSVKAVERMQLCMKEWEPRAERIIELITPEASNATA